MVLGFNSTPETTGNASSMTPNETRNESSMSRVKTTKSDIVGSLCGLIVGFSLRRQVKRRLKHRVQLDRLGYIAMSVADFSSGTDFSTLQRTVLGR